MDLHTLIQALGNTLDPDLRKEAETFLEGVHKDPNFTPCLLQIVVDSAVPDASRQAGAIYLKNCIFKYWKAEVPVSEEVEEVPYSLPEESKAFIRDNVVGAIIKSPLFVCRQLCQCLEQIVKHDFPDKCSQLVTQIHSNLSSDHQDTWLGSLLALYQLSKKYRYKKDEERIPYISAMATFLPLLYSRMTLILGDHSPLSVALQHHTLKIFHATMQYRLPLQLMDETNLPSWIELFKTILDRPVPQEAMEGEEEDRAGLEWWKCKKWALHILCRFFDRYSNPSSIEEEYNLFSKYYLQTFNSGVITVILKQLGLKQQGQFLTSRVLHGLFHYLSEAVDHGGSWKLIKPHFQLLFTDVVFPMMCYSEKDDELWKEDPYEYIRMKFDLFEDMVSPVIAAQNFVTEACSKRKGVLDPVLAFCISILQQPPDQRDYCKKDGALHVLGSVYESLMKKKYIAQLEPMLVTHVFPEFTNQLGYIRARACWMMRYFSEVQFTNQANLKHALQQVFNLLIHDQELPVKVEAAVAMQYLIKCQENAEEFIKPHVKPIIQELLVVIRETENDDLTEVMQQLIETYADQMNDVAVAIASNLVATFNELVDLTGETLEDDSYKALTALGIVVALQSLVKATFNQPQVMQEMEGVMFSMIASILQNSVMDLYEEMLSLMDLFTTSSVSPQMWQLLPVIYDTFNRDGFEFFSEMMSVLYNYVRVGTEIFLSNPRHLEMVVSMCKKVLTISCGEDVQTSACKLLEVVVIQCQGRIDAYIPSIMEVCLERLTRESKTADMRRMCLQVAIAALYCNPAQLMGLLETTRFPTSPEPITSQFFRQWISDAALFEGIHDRKVSVLGLCTVMQCQLRPEAVLAIAPEMVPAVVVQLDGLKDAYQKLAEEEREEEGEDGEDGDMAEDEEEDELEDEEDHVDTQGDNYIKQLSLKLGGIGRESESDDSELAQTLIEIDYETAIDDEDVVDEFLVFKRTLHTLSQQDPEWYSLLTSRLSPEQGAQVQELFSIADKRDAARQSRVIEQQGGYQFNISTLPNTFTFGGESVSNFNSFGGQS